MVRILVTPLCFVLFDRVLPSDVAHVKLGVGRPDRGTQTRSTEPPSSTVKLSLGGEMISTTGGSTAKRRKCMGNGMVSGVVGAFLNFQV